MRRPIRVLALGALAFAFLAFPLAAAADHGTRPHTKNIHAKGHSPDFGSFLLPDGQRDANSDLAFWGNLAFHGDYDGFRIVDISDPDNPQLVSRTRCNGDQGDIVVWENILVRSWNSPKTTARNCDGTVVPPGFEGVHVWDTSDLSDPQLVGEVELSSRPESDAKPFGCGSHTTTAVPDRANNRLIIYNATSVPPAGFPGCPFVSILEVPLDDPAAARWIRNEPLEHLAADHNPHDTGVILGDVNLMVTAAHDMTHVFSIGPPRGGSYEDPELLYTIEEEGVCNVPGPDPQRPCNGSWHSAALTWDGEVIILGWEPGGGSQPECEATDPPVKKSMFFYDADDGSKLGQWTLPRPQSSAENCTIHNYNIVPLRSGRYIAVGGHYQAGTWVTDFTNPAAATTVAWSDPPPLVPTQLGGAWSSYWYNNFIYESEISKGLNVFRVSDRRLAGAIRLPHLNPQTQEFSLD
jgi:LVIVD repeat-containing protein